MIKTKAEQAQMTQEELKEYKKRINRDRVQRYRDNNRDTPEYKQKHKEETYKYRKAHPDIIKKLNIKHSKTHYDKVKAITKIQSAIRNRNAKNEFDTRFNLKQEENKKTNAITKIQNAIRNRNAINEFASKYVERQEMNKVNDVLTQINQQKQKQNLEQLKAKLTASVFANDMLNSIIPPVINTIPNRKRGRPLGAKNKKKV